MSRYPANIITKSPATPTGPNPITGRAPGVWRMEDVAYWLKQGVWPDASADGYWPYTSLLLSSTSLSNASNNLFVDSSGAFNPVSRNGNTTQGSFTPYGSYWSNYFDGSGDYLTAPANAAFLLPGDFTVEAWIYIAGNALSTDGSGRRAMSVYNISQSGNFNFQFGILGDGTTTGTGMELYSNATGGVSVSGTITQQTWHHIAVCRSGSSVYFWLDGVQFGTTQTLSGSLGTSGATANIGRTNASGYPQDVYGYISNLRVVKGTALYTSAFTPSTSPLTAISGTSLLTCQSNRFIDNSSNAFTITVNGDTKVQKFSPFSPASAITYNQSDITNWSGYLNGSSYWTVPTSTALDVWDNGSGSFTVEAWIYATASIGNNVSIVAKAPNNGLSSWSPGWAFQVFNGYLNVNTPSDTRLFNSNTTSVPLNQWVHCALVKSGSTVSIYQNGVRVGTTTNSTAYSNTTDAVAIGVDRNFAGSKLTGYVSNVRMVKGTAVYDPTQSTLTVPTTNLTAVSGTSLLTLQSAAFTDNSGNNYLVNSSGTPTVTGNSPFNTTGYWSNYFDGSGDYLQAPNNSAFAFGTGNFTVEGWFYVSLASGTYGAFWDNRSSSTSAAGVGCWVDSADRIRVIMNNGTLIQTTGTITRNQWFHLAVVRSSGTVTVYYNGTAMSGGSTTGTTDITDTYFWIGRLQDNGFDYWGYSSNLRVVKGTAIYTSNFTVPTSPLTSVSGTSLLTCQNGRFIDNSTNAFTITVNGNTSVQPYNPFYTATIASNGGSMYFDGSGDWLSLPSSSAFDFGSGDFTIEFWMNTAASQSSDARPLGNWNNDGWSANKWSVHINHSSPSTPNQVAFWVYNILGTSTQLLLSTSTVNGKGWVHVAIVRSGTSFAMFINGTREATATQSGSVTNGAMPVFVGGSSAASDQVTGYLAGVRIVKGSAVYSPSSTTITVPTAPVTPTAATTLLLNGMNAGAYDATTINDMETVGNAQVTTAVSKYGGSSVYFDGSGDYLNAGTNPAFAFGTAPYTVEAWVYVTGSNTENNLVCNDTTNGFDLYFNYSSNTTRLEYRGGSNIIAFNAVPTRNTWAHVALVREGTGANQTKFYLNGVSQGSGTDAVNWTISGPMLIGGIAGAAYYSGYIDDLRITKGVARYTANFTPPTQAFPVY